MTQTLIEQLEALPRTHMYNHERKSGSDEAVCTYVKLSDLRAIIEQHQQEVAEPVFYVNHFDVEFAKKPNRNIHLDCKASTMKDHLQDTPLYTTPQPDIVDELVKALEKARPAVGVASDYYRDKPNMPLSNKYNKMLTDINSLLKKAREAIK